MPLVPVLWKFQGCMGWGRAGLLQPLGMGKNQGLGTARGQTIWKTGCKMILYSNMAGRLSPSWFVRECVVSDSLRHRSPHFQWLGYHWCLEDKVMGLLWMLSSTAFSRES